MKTSVSDSSPLVRDALIMLCCGILQSLDMMAGTDNGGGLVVCWLVRVMVKRVLFFL
jgi:hypothetical protein